MKLKKLLLIIVFTLFPIMLVSCAGCYRTQDTQVTQAPQGEKGDKGDTGEQGPQGEKGDKGDTGEQGPQGEAGNGISKIEKTGTEGFVDTYTITYTNGETTTFTVTNGSNGIQGIQGDKGDDGHSPVITIGENGNWFIDGVDTTKKAEGLQGETGNGISKIEKTGTEGFVDTYTITFTNGQTTTFTITNGSNGKSAYETYLEYHPEYTGTEEEWINTFINDNSCTVIFDSNGGTAVSPQIVSNQGGAAKPDDPTKEGYLFDGWYVDELKWNFYLYSVNQDITLKARWILDSFRVKTISNIDGGNYTNIDSMYQSNDEIPLTIELKPGYLFDGWYDSNNNLLSSNLNYTYVVPTSDTIITAKFSIEEYKVTYVVPDKTINENDDTFTYFTKIELSNPTLVGYQFAGWYKEAEFVNSISEVGEEKENITIYGKFVPKAYNLTLNTNLKYKITFNNNYENSENTETYIYTGESVEVPSTPTRTGYVFAGWYLDPSGSTIYDFSSAITNDLFLYAKWVAMDEVGTQIDAFDYNSTSSNLSTSTDITNVYYYFTAYESKDITVFVKDTGTKGYLNIYDMTTKSTVLDISQDSSSSYGSHNIAITNGHVYRMKVFGYTSASTDTISVYFSTINKIKSTGIASGQITTSIKYNDGINYVYNPKQGYCFIGFYDETDNYFNSLKYNVDRDLILTAKFEKDDNVYLISTNCNQDFSNYTIINSVPYQAGSEIELNVTEVSGYHFIGWFENDIFLTEEYNYMYIVKNHDSILTAKFELIKYNISYVIPDGTINDNPNFFTDFTTVELANPSLKGNLFGGWYLESGFVNKITSVGDVKEDITIYAKFVPNTYQLTLNTSEEYKVTYNHNYSGSTNKVVSVYSGNKLSVYTPTRSGYIFSGWFTDSGCTKHYYYDKAITGNFTLYAKWTEMLTGVSYSTKIINPSSYTSTTITYKSQTYRDDSTYVYFMVNDDNTHHVYVKNTANSGTMIVYNVTKKTQIASVSMNDYNFSSAKIECNKGDVVYVQFKPGYSSSSSDSIQVYFTGFSNLTSSATARSTIISNVNYGTEINFGTPKKSGKTFIGWFTDDDVLYDSKYYDVDYDLVLTAKFE